MFFKHLLNIYLHERLSAAWEKGRRGSCAHLSHNPNLALTSGITNNSARQRFCVNQALPSSHSASQPTSDLILAISSFSYSVPFGQSHPLLTALESHGFPAPTLKGLKVYGGGLVAKLCSTLATPWTVACQAPLSMGFSRQEYWSGIIPEKILLHVWLVCFFNWSIVALDMNLGKLWDMLRGREAWCAIVQGASKDLDMNRPLNNSDNNSSFIILPQFWLHSKVNQLWSAVAQLCPTLCNPVDCSLPGPSIHGIFQARVLECAAIAFSRRSSRPRDWTQVSCTAGEFIASEPSGKPNNQEHYGQCWHTQGKPEAW